MFTNFKEFFGVSSTAACDNKLDDLTNFRNAFAGESFNNGLFKVLKNEDVELWRDKVTQAFPKFADKFEPFACDWLGRLFCIRTIGDEPAIFVFHIGYNNTMLMPVDLLTFLNEEIPQYANDALSIDSFNEWTSLNPPVAFDDCVGVIEPIFLGGEDEMANMQVISVVEYWDTITNLIKNMPYSDRLLDHYEDFFGIEYQGVKLEDSPMFNIDPDFCIVKFPPTDDREIFVYATLGMSSDEASAPVELYMYSATENDMLVEILTATALYHRNDANLAVTDTIDFGMPCYEGSKCTQGLLCPPYIDGPEFEECGNISCLWLLPITQQEADFKIASSMDSLEQKFSECELNFVDYFRDSCV